jgi:hypothetical protein
MAAAKNPKKIAQKRRNNAQKTTLLERVVVEAESSTATQARNEKRVASRDGWKLMFLETFKNSGNIRAACMYADVERHIVATALTNDKDFERAYDIAENEAVDLLVAEAWNRARNGSDRLLEFLLKSHRKSVYAERPTEVAVAVKVDIDGQKPTDAILGKIKMMSGRLLADDSTDSDGATTNIAIPADG